jgi:hypothetical protein
MDLYASYLITWILDMPGKSKLRTFNALLTAGPGGTCPLLLAFQVGCLCPACEASPSHVPYALKTV